MDKTERLERMEKWKEIVDKASNSGIGIRAWCEQNEISASQYYYWHKVLIDQGIIERKGRQETENSSYASSASAPVQMFAEIDLRSNSPAAVDGRMDIRHILDSQVIIQRNGCQIFVGEGFSQATLGRVLEVVGNAS